MSLWATRKSVPRSRHSTHHGVRAQDVRLICPCQLEAKRQRSIVRRSLRVVGRIVSPIRIYGGGLLLALPLVFGATVPARDNITLVDRAIAVAEREIRIVESEPHLTLLTPGTRAAFGPTPPATPRLSLGNLREEFFKTQIPFGALIYQEAMRNDLSPELVAAIVKAESDFRPRLVSGKQALGLMQVMPSTGQLMGATNLMDPAENVRVGTKYLRYLHGRFGGDLHLVLAAYNAGEGNIARFGGIPPFKETEDYLQKVVVAKRHYQRQYARRVAARMLEENVRRASAR